MHKVTLISTEHRTSGSCNPDELCKIVESINPEVIFEEEPNDDRYQNIYLKQNSFKSLESETIIKYKLNHDIVHIPVDKKINHFVSIEVQDYIFEKFRKHHAYMKLTKDHCKLRDEFGFSYLNSQRCREMSVKMKRLEVQIVNSSGTEKGRLIHLYNLFHNELNKREEAMLQNIYNYCKKNKFNRAVFFLGFLHRESIEKKISEYESKENFRVNWRLYNDITN